MLEDAKTLRKAEGNFRDTVEGTDPSLVRLFTLVRLCA